MLTSSNVNDITGELQQLIATKLREIISYVGVALNEDLAEDLEDVQKHIVDQWLIRTALENSFKGIGNNWANSTTKLEDCLLLHLIIFYLCAKYH